MLKKILVFLGIWAGLAIGLGLILGIYGMTTGTEISDMTYGYMVWTGLGLTIVYSIIKKVLKK